jgi:hypothetical protein
MLGYSVDFSLNFMNIWSNLQYDFNTRQSMSEMFSTIAIFYNVTLVSYRNVGQLGRGNYLAVFSVRFPGLFRIINAASELDNQFQILIRLFSKVRFFYRSSHFRLFLRTYVRLNAAAVIQKLC